MKITHELDDVMEFYSVMVGDKHFEVHIQDGIIMGVFPEDEEPPELRPYVEDNIILKDDTAILDCVKRTIKFKKGGQIFTLDLTQGDLEDSWGSIHVLIPNEPFDTNFYWEEDGGEHPSFVLYGVKDGQVDTSDEHPIKIIKQIGTARQYFDYIPEGNMTREEVIQQLVNKEIDNIKEDINTDVSVLGEYLENGFKGYANFTDEELTKEYVEVFDKHIKIK